ncbi:hypothetical protein [Mahella sp.]|uniref:hypothetical protein n=1 Tax=Mahella sp. TaxID=2798721 RepID=UPI0025C18B5B|nr:hypothetical protein [Mahella sp.]MBZ4664754.1 hypothetical protein [Mahella sp.]MDK2902558.1 hypothetical protein [Clostridiales bacterium]
MKRTLYPIFIIILLALVIIILYHNGNTADTVFLSSDSSYPIYGESAYSSSVGDIKISVEKIIQERYFIVYSWSTGDESYFGITFLVENIKKERLSKDDFKVIWLVDDKGETHQPIPYFEILDFPEDQPLGWKQVINCKFWPLAPEIKYIDINIKYGETLFMIKGVPVQ